MAVKKEKNEEAAAESSNATSTPKKPRSVLNYPPYVNAYGSIGKLFEEIRKASVPPKFTQDFLETVLGMKSSSHRALIPLLKRMQFLDAANVPTEAYKLVRDPSQAGTVMAARVKEGYELLFRLNEYANTLGKDELVLKLRTNLGASEDDPNVLAAVSTFLEFVKLSSFDANRIEQQSMTGSTTEVEQRRNLGEASGGLNGRPGIGLSYTINLNLPATTEIEVFHAIFKSLKEHLLDG